MTSVTTPPTTTSECDPETSPRNVEVEGEGGSSGRDCDDSLPKNFDLLIIGSGLVESIVSAAASRNGHSVLHIDSRDYYGGAWGSFGLDQWTSATFLETPEDVQGDVDIEGIGKVTWGNQVKCFEQIWYEEDESTKEGMMKQRRRFNIDLMAKLISAREDITELLIKSNVSRYLEFLRVSKILTNFPPPEDTKLEPIPLSRADIFTSKSLYLVEKRNLVKFIEAVLRPNKKEEDVQEDKETPQVPETFQDLLTISKASDKVKEMVKASVTSVDDGFSQNEEKFNQEFCGRCRLLLNSIGRYGNQTPFLWTLYGISEICQAFCRLSAVYGGIFILKRYLSSIMTTEDGYLVKTGTDQVTAKHIVLGPELKCDISGKERNKKEHSSIVLGRAVLITKGGNLKAPEESTKSKSQSQGDGIFLYKISGVEVIELNHGSQAVASSDYHLLQISFPILDDSKGNESSYCKDHIEKVMEPFLNFKPNPETESDTKPQVIYGSYFILHFQSDSISSQCLVHEGENESKYFVMESGVASTDLSSYVAKAKQIFNTLYPEEEFLPKAPDCEEDAAEVNGHDDDTPEIAVEAVAVEGSGDSPSSGNIDDADEESRTNENMTAGPENN